MLNTVTIGDIGESVAVMKFLKKGCAVSKPLTNNARYDLIVEINNKLYKVQVKSTQSINAGKMVFATKTTNYTKGSWENHNYTTDEVDIFFLYCVDNDWCGLYIPSIGEDIQKGISIRVEKPKNNQKVGIHMCEDYEFDKQFASLA